MNFVLTLILAVQGGGIKIISVCEIFGHPAQYNGVL